MAGAASSLGRLLARFSDAMLAGRGAPAEFEPPHFPLAREILAAGPLSAPLFWSRFDVFERAGGGLAVLEYNADKPAGQREIWAAEALGPARGNPNRGALARFRTALAAAWARHRSAPGRAGPASPSPRMAILVDPAHREELHLAYLFGRVAGSLGWTWEVTGPANLAVEGGRATAYGERVDIVLRQYPAEFLHELPAAADLWRASSQGRLLWLNDPRAVLAQAKSAFAHLWELVRQERWLTDAERRAIRRHVPPTGLASSPGWLERAAARREDWVIKPVLGRYSEGVALGPHCTREDWQRALERAAARPRDFVVQAYAPPRRRWLPAAAGGRAGYVNWGAYLTEGRFEGLCPRFQPAPLTDERTAWWAPLRVRRRRLDQPRVERPAVGLPREPVPPRGPARRPAARGPGREWQSIADRQSLAGYTNIWTDGLANFTLAAVGLTPATWDELAHATSTLSGAIGRVLTHLEGRPALVASLGIPRPLAELATRPRGDAPWSFLSRLDWARTRGGRWKLMEINSDTPAGLWEAGPLSADLARLHRGTRRPGGDFETALTASWRRSCTEIFGAAADRALVIGLIAAPESAEDQDQLRAHARAARRALPRADLVACAPERLEVRAGRAWLHGRPLDLLFRYYPMDWLADARFLPLLDLLRSGDLAMLPAARALVPQSKAFLALLWELVERDFFPPAEAAAIVEHVALSTLDPRRFIGRRHVVKPYLEREGLGVRFAADLGPRERRQIGRSEVVYQERLDLVSARLPVASSRGWSEEERFLVFGVFVAGSDVAGVYTRAGARITGREAVFVPAVLDSSTNASR